jgi:urea transporter
MNTLVTDQAIAFIAVIEQAGLPALRVAFSIAALVFLYAGVLIFPKRHQFVDSRSKRRE